MIAAVRAAPEQSSNEQMITAITLGAPGCWNNIRGSSIANRVLNFFTGKLVRYFLLFSYSIFKPHCL
jgi:hypothetical protein